MTKGGTFIVFPPPSLTFCEWKKVKKVIFTFPPSCSLPLTKGGTFIVFSPTSLTFCECKKAKKLFLHSFPHAPSLYLRCARFLRRRLGIPQAGALGLHTVDKGVGLLVPTCRIGKTPPHTPARRENTALCAVRAEVSARGGPPHGRAPQSSPRTNSHKTALRKSITLRSVRSESGGLQPPGKASRLPCP